MRRRSTWQDSERNGRHFGRKLEGCSPPALPSRDTISHVWSQLKIEAARQDTSVFETSSVMAVSAARALPDGVRWLSASARVGATRTGQIFAAALLDHYKHTLSEMQEVGYLAYVNRQFRPYVRAAVDQFSPKRRTVTERLIEKLSLIRSGKGQRPSDPPDLPTRGLTTPAGRRRRWMRDRRG
jgi:hypothetical protein